MRYKKYIKYLKSMNEEGRRGDTIISKYYIHTPPFYTEKFHHLLIRKGQWVFNFFVYKEYIHSKVRSLAAFLNMNMVVVLSFFKCILIEYMKSIFKQDDEFQNSYFKINIFKNIENKFYPLK